MSFLTEFPVVDSQDISDAIEQLNSIQFYNSTQDLSEVSVDETGALFFNDGSAKISSLGIKPLAGLVRYPLKNFDVLSNGRLSGDLNSLFKASERPPVIIRHAAGMVYDVRMVNKRRQQGFAPSPSTSLRRLRDEIIDFDSLGDMSVSYRGGKLRFIVRRSIPDLIVNGHDINSTGVVIEITDYGKHTVDVSYNIYRTSCENSAVGIRTMKYLFHPDTDRLGKAFEYANSLLINIDQLSVAYQRLSENPLSPFTVRKIENRMRSKLGAKATYTVLMPYFNVKLEADVFSTTGRYKKIYEVNEDALMNKSEFDFMNDITAFAHEVSDLDIKNRLHEVGGSLVDDQMTLMAV